jgi:hypothetical protein
MPKLLACCSLMLHLAVPRVLHRVLLHAGKMHANHSTSAHSRRRNARFLHPSARSQHRYLFHGILHTCTPTKPGAQLTLPLPSPSSLLLGHTSCPHCQVTLFKQAQPAHHLQVAPSPLHSQATPQAICQVTLPGATARSHTASMHSQLTPRTCQVTLPRHTASS